MLDEGSHHSGRRRRGYGHTTYTMPHRNAQTSRSDRTELQICVRPCGRQFHIVANSSRPAYLHPCRWRCGEQVESWRNRDDGGRQFENDIANLHVVNSARLAATGRHHDPRGPTPAPMKAREVMSRESRLCAPFAPAQNMSGVNNQSQEHCTRGAAGF